VIATILLLTLAPTRPLDPEVPTEVPAPAGEEPEIDDDTIETDEPAEPPPPPGAAALDVGTTPQQGKPKKRWPDSKRKGALVMAGIGAGGCTQDQCEPLKATPWLSLMGGYRFGRFAPVLVVQGGAAPADAPDAVAFEDDVVPLTESTDTRGFLHVGVGTLLHLLASTPFDPYFGLTIGYLRTSARFRGNGSPTMSPGTKLAFDFVEVAHRGTLGVVIGLGFRIRERFTIGPRVDVLVPFSGKLCVGNGGEDKTCIEMKDVESIDPGQYFPRPWAATLQVGFVI
jgi:hypothetical protein